MTTRVQFDIHLNAPGTGVVHAADCVLEEDAGFVRRVDFRYTLDYLAHPRGFPLDPERLPLRPGEAVLRCRGGVPGFIDDHLPDAWGRKVLAALALHRDARRLNVNSAIELLALVPAGSRIGALSFTRPGEPPSFPLGAPMERLGRTEQVAAEIDALDWQSKSAEEFGLAHLAEAGSGVGGARPKALVTDEDVHSCEGHTPRAPQAEGSYLAKFNRLSGDPYNNARVELACLDMARAIGLNVTEGKVVEDVNGRDVLLLKRFDLAPDGSRRHLVTVNALLKEPATQRDSGLAFRYDDVADLLSRHSVAIEADLKQLARLALFNRAINNTDDHSRNFSLINDGEGYRLSPAYDLVPQLAMGEYHAAGFSHRPNPPKPSEVSGAGRVFGLSRTWLRNCADEVITGIDRWGEFAEAAGVDESERDRLGRLFNP